MLASTFWKCAGLLSKYSLKMARITNPNGYDVLDNAPSTLKELKAYKEKHGKIAVMREFSDKTIFVDESISHAFRVWHDAAHLELEAEFDGIGETIVCCCQAMDVMDIIKTEDQPYLEDIVLIMEAEVIGQYEYKMNHGTFPTNQVAFDREYCENREKAIRMVF